MFKGRLKPPPTQAVIFLAGCLLGAALVTIVGSLRPDADADGPQRPRSLLNPLTTPPADYRWTSLPDPTFPIPPYAFDLHGVRIVIDPGHGGRADEPNYKIGPTGLREAEVNLSVARFLKEFLDAVGADVRLTRERDVYLHKDKGVDLQRRAQIADEFRADLLLSLHHNAAGNPQPNRTEAYYHDSPDRSPASLDAARHLLAGLDEALRLEDHLPCALLSDKNLTRNGFLLLRETQTPAVIIESSYFTNPAEEDRLRDPLYNRREAYGLFLGLARWAHHGLPGVELVKPTDGRVKPGDKVIVKLNDGLSDRARVQGHEKLFLDSILVRLDGRLVSCEYDAKNDLVVVPVPSDLGAGRRTLHIDFVNLFGQHVLHPRLEIVVER